jgi:anti-anti-sigma factor
MGVTTTFHGRAAVVRIDGRLDRHCCLDLRSALDDLVRQRRELVVVDLEDTESLDSSALGVVVRAWKEGEHRGVLLRLARPREPVLRMLEVTGLARLLRVFATIEEACEPG